MKLTKTFLNKFIKWTTSRYNEFKKQDVVDEIYTGLKEGCIKVLMWKPHTINFDYIEMSSLNGKPRIYRLIYKRIYGCGSYCPCSSMGSGYDYIVDFKEKSIIKGLVGDDGKIIKIIEKINFNRRLK